MSVLVVTSLGDITIDLFTDLCPLTTKNFLKLCKIKYYNGCLFHTIQPNFLAQTGDPTGTGTGGDSFYKLLYGDQARFFSDEINPNLTHSKLGTVSMASAGENLNASQFYVTLRDSVDYLDGKHTVFGEVAEGFETLKRINEAYCDEKGRPYRDIRVKHTYVVDDPFDDPPEMEGMVPERSPVGKPKEEVLDEVRLEDDWVPMDEKLDVGEMEEVIREKEARSRAVVLESVGDIPDADVKPPENVLFVCKLNPVTEDEDLHTIFSRFGTVGKAEVIRDYKTGDSLCYAFIEFEDKEACEMAYFKMDNALIDDRRIHVDFSQSVSKLWNQFRRKGSKQQGEGCFKCGELDHIAKDCTAGGAGPNVKQNHQQKYVLKENDHQRGGDNNKKFDMVFDEEHARSPRRGKRNRERDRDDETRSRISSKNGEERGYPKEPSDRFGRGRKRDEEDSSRRDRNGKKKEKGYEAGDRQRDSDDEIQRSRKGDSGYNRGREGHDDDGRGHDDRRGKRDDESHKKRRDEYGDDGRGHDDRRGKRDDESHKKWRDEYGDGRRSRRDDSQYSRRSDDHDDKHSYDERRGSSRR